MAKLPEERWPTCGALVEGARSALADGSGAIAVRPRRPRGKLVVAAGAGLVAGVSVIAALLFGGGGTPIASGDSLVRLDPGGAPQAGVVLGGQPTAVTVCGGSVWVTSLGGEVSQIDPKTLTTHTIRVRGRPTDVADVGDLAAVVSGAPEQVTMVDAGFGQISNVVALRDGRAPATAAAFGRDVWVANPSGGELDLLDPPYTAVTRAVPLSGAPRLVAAGAGAVWAVGGRTLWKIAPGSRRVVARIRLPFAPQAVAAGNGGVWLVDAAEDALVRLDPSSGRVTSRIRVGEGPAAVAVGPGSVWVANRGDGTVSRIDARGNAVAKTIHVGAEPVDLVVGLGGVWVARRA